MNAIDRIRLDRIVELHEILDEDHKQILTLVDELIVPQTPRSTEELAMLLQELQNSLLGHFAREQSPGGFYDYVGACSSDHRRELRVLLNEHISMLSTIHTLTERALPFNGKVSSEAKALELHHGATDLSVRLFEHELKENTLVNRLVQFYQSDEQAIA